MEESKKKTAKKHLILLTVGVIGILVLLALLSLWTGSN
jgi:hypothetical protein